MGIIGYLFYKHQISKGVSKSETKKQLLKEIQEVDFVRVDPETGRFSYEIFQQIFRIITKYSQLEFKKSSDSMRGKRRYYLENKDMNRYRQIVLSQTRKETEIYTYYSDYVLGELGLREDNFVKTQHHYMQIP